MSSSREYLDMDSGKSTSSIKFKAKNGFFIDRWVACFLFLLFLACIVAVGLLVYFLFPRADVTLSDTKSSNITGDAIDARKKSLDVFIPKTLTPLHYRVELQTFFPPDGNFSFAGQLQLKLHCLVATNKIILHIFNISVHEATVRVTSAHGEGATVAIKDFSYDSDRQFFIVNLGRNLSPNEEYNISMKFLGLLNEDLAGFYRSSYLDETGNTRWLAVTQFQPTDARRAFPCFDEPGYKATFDIILVRPSSLSSISNMPIERTEDRPNNFKADIYQRTVKMSTYLLAFVVSDFSFKSNNASQTRFSVWARTGAMQQVEYALEAGPKALDFFETYFNVSFPLPKQDMIAVPDFRAGAMENWGLITYRESALLWDSKISSLSSKQYLLTIIAHELAHQWFGNLVTPKWWDDLWLNEGFASYIEYVGSNHVEPSWNMLDQFVTTDLQDVFELDSLESSHPISVPVKHPDEINEIFDKISYGKGASVIRMMLHFLGESTFRKGLSNYLKGLSYQNAEQDDLWRYLSEASKEDGSNISVKEVMDTWTRQIGYPVVNVTRDYHLQTAVLTQERFFLIPKERKSDKNTETWHIPITYTTSLLKDYSDTRPRLWFYKNNESIHLTERDGIPGKNDWVLFNVNETAYHRVNYDEDNWKLLITQLETDHKVINDKNRAQILDDALDLARANKLNYSIALSVTKYLSKEMEYVPWQAATSNYYFIDQMLRLSSAYGKWMKYVLQQVTAVYDKIGFDEKSSDPHLDKMNRVTILNWACLMGNKDCLQKSSALYGQWMSDPDSDPLTPSLKRVISCFAIEQGGEAEWNFAYERYLKSNVGTEKNLLLLVMSCTKQPWILGKYLSMAFEPNSTIRKADSPTVFSSVAQNVVGRSLAFDFIRDKWALIKEMHGSGFFALSKMVKSVTESLNTPFELKQLTEFIESRKVDLGSATRSFYQAIEETKANTIWMENNYNAVDSWLKENVI